MVESTSNLKINEMDPFPSTPHGGVPPLILPFFNHSHRSKLEDN